MGYKYFQKQYFQGNQELYEELVKNGQRPTYLVIACSDSRVDPALILNCKPGDLFVVRNVANLVPPYEFDSHYHGTSAALEFGICGLGIKHIIILGHSQCGGITTLLESYGEKAVTTKDSFISKWMELANPACTVAHELHSELSLEEKSNHCAMHSILSSVENLYTFPWIKEKVDKKQLLLHAWYFDLKTGNLNCYNDKLAQFEVLI